MRMLAVTGYYKPAYIYGGPVRSNAALFEGLAKLGVDVTVITTNANGNETLDVPQFTPLDIDGVNVIYCPTKPLLGTRFYSPTQIAEAKRLIPRVDIVNLQTFWGYATHPLSNHCIQHKKPFYVSLRGQLMDYAMKNIRWTKRLKKYLFLYIVGYRYLNNAMALHATSSLEITQLQEYPIYTPTFLVPNGIMADVFICHNRSGSIREQYRIPDEALVLVMIGRLHPVKNPHIAVSALIAAQTLPTDVHLIMVGPDEQNMKQSLMRQARKAGCANLLHFTGLVQKATLMKVMADSDLFIMPSESENFGMSAAECMAVGLPILVSDRVPIGEWAKEASAGEIAPCNEDAFSAATVTMLSNPCQLKEMGPNGKAVATNLFHPDIVAKEMLKNLEQLIDQNQIT